MTDKVRVRFAPSPTGLLHIGGLRTALYNYLFARHHGGDFILRIEDTDQTRYVEGAEEDILKSLEWAGFKIDEGPANPGKVGPYRQSERSEIYRTYVDQLIEREQAYICFDTPGELEDMRERLVKSGNPSPKYDAITRMSMKNSLTLPRDEVDRRMNDREPYVVRLKVPRRETIRFEDDIRGFVSFESHGLDDQVLLKSDGLPTYHLANVVDDHLMGITHVIRGEEWLSSAPKHILLYKYLEWEMPHMAHLPLIMSPEGGKLSKRNAQQLGMSVNVKDYREQHYLPEALLNFLAFLGWNPGDDRELLSLQELIDEFTLDRVSKSGAVFNPKKLLWYNEQYLRNIPGKVLLPEVRDIAAGKGISEVTDEYLMRVIQLMKERAQRIGEFITEGLYFFKAPEEYDPKTSKKAWKDGTSALVEEYASAIENRNEWKAAGLKEAMSAILEEKGLGFGKLAQPVRLAVTGVGYGPDLFQLLELLGKDEVIKRLKNAARVLG